MVKKQFSLIVSLFFIMSVSAADVSSVFSDIVPKTGFKSQTDHNPLMTQHFGADPYAMVYDGRVYVYMTYDSFRYDSDGNLADNTYSQIQQLYCISSADMVNWTDHGPINAAGASGAAKWAGCSWAPTACHKNIDGKEKFFLYFANNANGIGVLTSDSPTGPWTDPLGSALVSRSTANCSDVTWLFDPAVLIDDDGSAYLYFGGGAPDGATGDAKNYPKTARVAKLSSDMISLDGDPVSLNPPYLFEDAGANKIGDKYVYSYCTNWNCSDPGGAVIAYMTSSSPMTDFSYVGGMFKNPGTFFSNCYGNNHHSMVKFNNQYYLFYHTQLLQNEMGISGGYRCTHVDRIDVDESNALISYATGTKNGVSQVQFVDAFSKNEAECFAWMAGVDTKSGGENVVVASADKGDWIGISGVDFGNGVSSFSASLSSVASGSAMKVCVDSVNGRTIGFVEAPNTDGLFSDVNVSLTDSVAGIHDLFFVFSGALEFDSWSFNGGSVSISVSANEVKSDENVDVIVKADVKRLESIDVLMDGVLMSSSSSSTANFNFSGDDMSSGKHYFYAIARDSNGAEVFSDSVMVRVLVEQTAFNNAPQQIPGVVEMEFFDEGGEGYAYHDEDIDNKGNSYRMNEDVDIAYLSSDSYALGWTLKGEWVEYTVDVLKNAKYQFSANVASGLDGSGFILYVDDMPVSDFVEVPNTGSWTAYSSVVDTTEDILPGSHILKLYIAGSYCNIDNITFTAIDSTESCSNVVNASRFMLFPNPASDVVFIDGLDENCSAELYAADGTMVISNVSPVQDISHLDGGVYVLKVSQKNGKTISKTLVIK